MLALSVRPIWAWLIIYGGKDIENRTWHTKLRGRVLIHASRGLTRAEFDLVVAMRARAEVLPDAPALPELARLKRGGVIGSVDIVDCVSSSDSPWFVGPVGFVLREPRPHPFHQCKGRLGFFEVPEL